MESLKRYLEKLLNIPGLSWFTLGTGAFFVFSGWPMLGSFIEKLLPWGLGYDKEPWAGQELYLVYFVLTFLLFMVGLWWDRKRRVERQHTMLTPPYAPVVVMMASRGELHPTIVEELLAQTNPSDFWRTHLTQDQGPVQVTWRPLNGHASNLERVRIEIIALQVELQRRGYWATYDLTGLLLLLVDTDADAVTSAIGANQVQD